MSITSFCRSLWQVKDKKNSIRWGLHADISLSSMRLMEII